MLMSTGFKDLHWFSSCMAVICKEPCVIEDFGMGQISHESLPLATPFQIFSYWRTHFSAGSCVSLRHDSGCHWNEHTMLALQDQAVASPSHQHQSSEILFCSGGGKGHSHHGLQVTGGSNSHSDHFNHTSRLLIRQTYKRESKGYLFLGLTSLNCFQHCSDQELRRATRV